MSEVSPSAKVIIYNYKDRGGDKPPSPLLSVHEIDVSEDVVAINTQKSKSEPSGSFMIQLAPTHNWVNVITPNSWLVIAISRNPIEELNYKTIKMIGRVDTIRTQSSIDQTGTVRTSYMVAGRDWGQIFEGYVNIDPAFVGQSTGLAAIFKMSFGIELKDFNSKKFSTNTDELMNFCLNLFNLGGNERELSSRGFSVQGGALFNSSGFEIPYKLASVIGNNYGTSMASLIKLKTGILTGEDKYKEEVESLGILNVQALLGYNTLWSIINAHANLTINEVFTELSEESGTLTPTLYKRVKPFYLKKEGELIPPPFLTIPGNIKSEFINLKSYPINSTDIITIDLGTNGRDIVNFIELSVSVSTSITDKYQAPLDSLIKGNNTTFQLSDQISIARDGLRPLKLTTSFFPPNVLTNNVDYTRAKQWLPVLRNWYFNTHMMFNGTVSIIGMNEYIPVGSNIRIQYRPLFNGVRINSSSDTFITAHVESVSHRFLVERDGTNKFLTTITFSRGISTTLDEKDNSSFGIDMAMDQGLVSEFEGKNTFRQ